MKYLSFDIETGTITPEGEDPHKFRPLGICIAATQLVDTFADVVQTPITWAAMPESEFGEFSYGEPGVNMHPTQVCNLIDYICDRYHEGYIPLTWNGLGFDFDILAEESMSERHWYHCKDLALHHVDMAFQMLCEKGYMIGMQAAALGFRLPGKSEGMHGDLAPKLWAESPEGRFKVAAYVKQDVQTTTDINKAALQLGGVRWTSKSGRPNFWPVHHWKTVTECLKIAKPDTSWMTQPRTRESYLAWTTKENPYAKRSG